MSLVRTYTSVSSLSDRVSLWSFHRDGYEVINNDITYDPGQHQIGEGSFAKVVPVTFKGRPAAYKQFKTCDDSAAQKAQTEAKLMSSLKHENIVGFYAVIKTPETLGLLLELMSGGSMTDLLHNQPHIHYYVNHVFSWAHQITKALSYIHSKHYLHRDLKPANILLSANFRILKLCDFGASCNYRLEMTDDRGSPVYMAPEVFEGHVYDEKCDIYSFGVTLWEIVSRVSAAEGLDRTNPFAVQYSKIFNDHRPPKIIDIPEPLAELINRCWHRDPQQRPCAAEVKDIIKCLLVFYDHHNLPILDLTTKRPVRSAEIMYVGTVYETERHAGRRKPKSSIRKMMSKCSIM
uniref:Mitogen-activated protein kinase kinase kinase n=1 Tax=Panagrellus redivivus TaxID=6233 RepID=A0A7E4VEU3_PANRE